MDSWKTLQSSLGQLNLGQSASKIAKGFNSSVQATRERLGQVAQDEITELPQEYKELEARVDALRAAHIALLKIAGVYASETYDYPVQIQESLSELGTTIGQGFNTLKDTVAQQTGNAPTSPTSAGKARDIKTEKPHKTLPHALARASIGAANVLPNGDKLGKGLAEYAAGLEKVGEARVEQDLAIRNSFLSGWQTTLNSSINVAMKARQAVKASRLELDAAKQTLKNASPSRQEHARLEVENAEDDLVQKTEVAITLMKTVLENPEPLRNLNALVHAQLAFYAASAEALSAVQGEIEELSVQAEGEYRKSRDH